MHEQGMTQATSGHFHTWGDHHLSSAGGILVKNFEEHSNKQKRGAQGFVFLFLLAVLGFELGLMLAKGVPHDPLP
jgi:hypothetical protein